MKLSKVLWQAMDAAAYRVLIAAAEAIGDTQTKAVCERSLEEELLFASRALPIRMT
jgi:ferritin-like metal-binding protein YciE